jgi:hypothetical protein
VRPPTDSRERHGRPWMPSGSKRRASGTASSPRSWTSRTGARGSTRSDMRRRRRAAARYQRGTVRDVQVWGAVRPRGRRGRWGRAETNIAGASPVRVRVSPSRSSLLPAYAAAGAVNAEDAGKEPTTVRGAVLLTGGAHDSTNLRASAFACGCRISPRQRPFVVDSTNRGGAVHVDSTCSRGLGARQRPLVGDLYNALDLCDSLAW